VKPAVIASQTNSLVRRRLVWDLARSRLVWIMLLASLLLSGCVSYVRG